MSSNTKAAYESRFGLSTIACGSVIDRETTMLHQRKLRFGFKTGMTVCTMFGKGCIREMRDTKIVVEFPWGIGYLSSLAIQIEQTNMDYSYLKFVLHQNS